jgi:hypothetical protein
VRVVLLDTLGFDDTYVTELGVLQLIADWLEKTCVFSSSWSFRSDLIPPSRRKHNIKLTGIVYLQSVADRRMTGSTLTNLRMFERLCGDHPMVRIVLTTTKWEDVSREDGEEREAEIKEKMLCNGATVDRLRATDHDEAWRVVDGLIAKHEATSYRKESSLFKQTIGLSSERGSNSRILTPMLPASITTSAKAKPRTSDIPNLYELAGVPMKDILDYLIAEAPNLVAKMGHGEVQVLTDYLDSVSRPHL